MSKNDFLWLRYGLVVATVLGAVIGYMRYQSGVYLLGLNFFIAMLIPFITRLFIKNKISKKDFQASKLFKISLFMMFAFIFGELLVVSFFENPFEWIDEILSHGEDMLLIEKEKSADGVAGGWWVFLNLLDLGWMHFVLLISTSIQMEKRIES